MTNINEVIAKFNALKNRSQLSQDAHELEFIENVLGSIKSDVLKDNVFELPKPYPYQSLDVTTLNDMSQQTADILLFLSEFFQEIRSDFSKSHTLVESAQNSLRSSMGILKSKVATFRMYNYSDFDNVLIFSDNFYTADNINSDTLLLPNACSVNHKEGILTLPVDEVINVPSSELSFTIGDESIGSVQDESTPSFINNSSALFKFALKNTALKLTDQCKLVLYVTLKTPAIINHIDIDLVNLGNSDYPTVKKIEGSLDGISYIDIIDRQASVDQDISTNNKGTTTLGTDTDSTHSWTFSPARAKSFRITIEQNKPHVNLDSEYEYSIGLDNVKITGIKYAASGIFSSTIFESQSPISQASLETTDNLAVNSTTMGVNYSLNVDNNDIPISKLSDSNSNEILYFNQPWHHTSIDTDQNPLMNVALKADMFRNTLRSNDTVWAEINQIHYNEYINVPTGAPYEIALKHAPIKETFKILMYPYISVGKDIKIKIGQTNVNKNTYTFQLPFAPKSNLRIKIDEYELERYERISDLMDYGVMGFYVNDNNTIRILIRDLSRKHNPDSHLDHKDPISTPAASFPTELENTAKQLLNSNIDIFALLDPEIITATAGRVLNLGHTSDGIVENIKVSRLYLDNSDQPIYQQILDFIPAGETQITLSRLPLKDAATKPVMVESYEVDYINGTDEFVENRGYAYSIDYTNGILHRRVHSIVDLTITYTAQHREAISSDLYRLLNPQAISLSPAAYIEGGRYEVEYNVAATLPEDTYVFTTDNKISLTDKTILDVFTNQVEYTGKLIRAEYDYQIDADDSLIDIQSFMTPILREYKLLTSSLAVQ